MTGVPVSWAVCGGYALDLFLDRTFRVHGDIDLCVFEPDRDAIVHSMLRNNWRVYEFRGQGKVRPLDDTSSGDAGRNLMCVTDDCELVKFYPCEEEGLLYHQFFHTGIRRFNYVEFLFNTATETHFIFNKTAGIERERSEAIRFRQGIPYLAPEIVLLYKASQADKPEYRDDFEQTYPSMNSESREWFFRSLEKLYPDGHRWQDEKI